MTVKSLISALLLLMVIPLGAQIFDPVKWQTSFEHVADDDYLIIFEAEIEPGWAVYSQYLESDEGPVATTLNFDAGDHFELKGDAKESGHRKEGFDAIFEMNVVKYLDEFRIEQPVRLLKSGEISGYLNFMTCDDERCLPPKDVEFSVLLQASADDDGSHGASSLPTDQVEDLATDGSTDSDAGGFAGITDIDLGDTPLLTDDGLLEPVQWSATYADGQVVFTAHIDAGWHIYSQDISDEGPIPTEFYLAAERVMLEEASSYAIEEPDEFFDGLVIKKIKKEATYTLTLENDDLVQGEITYMTCNDEKCVTPPPVTFEIDPSAETVALDVDLYGPADMAATEGGYYGINEINLDEPLGQCEEVHGADLKSKSLLNIFILGLIGGLLAIITPCVFPMIPLTVSFFTKGSEDKKKGLRRAALYGFFILMVYVVLSLPFHLLDSVNPGILNEISTNAGLNIFFFVVFVFFAFSFFGYYELTIPASWTNRVSNAEGIGGTIGVFFMALTLALVSFSCTGPILGSLLAGSLTSDGGAMQLTAGMSGFGFALALPFALFAAFPGWLGSLPKSGSWLNTVKVVLGFLELALAFKFLSAADLVKRWGLLKIEPFLIIEGIIFIGLALYLFGRIKFPHDSPLRKLSFSRISLGVLALAFAVYLASGFRVDKNTNTFTSLTLLSGLAPPVGYSWMYPNQCPNDLDCFKDLEKGLAYAKKVDKPVMLDFTGHACVNCRKMEEHVWPKRQVIDMLREDYVLISLYVDEKVELPAEEQSVVEKRSGGTRKLRTIGNKWEHFQTEYFNNNSQPYYALLSPDGQLLNPPIGYTPDVEEYAAFLSCGLDAFRASNGEGVGVIMQK